MRDGGGAERAGVLTEFEGAGGACFGGKEGLVLGL